MAFRDLAMEKLGLSVSELVGDFSFTVYGGRGIHVEGHKGILYLSEEEITFKHKKRNIKIVGHDLSILEFSSTDAYVKGEILSVLIEGKNV
ncbi:MAG: YabP/YqfC family sporulation protein [Clostridia bacterium]|nr:YabP/YqfC family sporulation protein [Clostridia bacterium]